MEHETDDLCWQRAGREDLEVIVRRFGEQCLTMLEGLIADILVYAEASPDRQTNYQRNSIELP
jgi:hypothetical protein